MKMPGIVAGLLFNGSRKFGLGLWIVLLGTVLLFKGMLDSDKWMLCVGFSSTLIGGGTLMDTYLGKKKNDTPPSPQ